MNEARFMELLGVYGADLVRWPEEDRGSAAAFLEVAPHRIKDIWESERTFDHLLALEKDSPASISLETQILSTVPARRSLIGASGGPSLWTLPKWATGGALAASLALGFAVGYAGEPSRSAETDYASMLTISDGGAGSMYLTAMNDGGR
jgi:hypothetical protein